MKRCSYILIGFQENFENIDNLQYFYKLRKKISNDYQIKIIRNKFYRGSIIKKQNHYYFIAKKI